VSKLPSTDHLCNHSTPARLEEENVSAQSIKIHALNMFLHPVIFLWGVIYFVEYMIKGSWDSQ